MKISSYVVIHDVLNDHLRYPALNIMLDKDEAIYMSRTLNVNRGLVLELISDAHDKSFEPREVRNNLCEILMVFSRHVSFLNDKSYFLFVDRKLFF